MDTACYKPKMGMLTLVAIVYQLLWATTPPMLSGMIFRIAGLLCTGFCFLKLKGNEVWKIIFLITVILFATVLTGDSLNYRINTLIFLCFLLCGMTFDWYTVSPKTAERIVMLLFLNCIIWEMFTFRAIMVVPSIMRLAVGASFVAPFGVGGYGFLYTVVLLVPVSMDYMLDKHRKVIYRGVAAMFTLSTIFLAYKSQYLMGVVIAFSEVAFYFIFGIKNKNLRLLMTAGVTAAVLLIYLNAENIIYFFLNTLKSGALYRKLLDILAMLHGESTVESGEFGERYERYTRDLGLMLRSPIWGSLRYMAIGKHSNILDMFAQYGLPVGFLYTSLLRKRIVRWRISVTKVILLAVLLLFGLNSQTYQMGAVYMLIPLYAALSPNMKGKGEAHE